MVLIRPPYTTGAQRRLASRGRGLLSLALRNRTKVRAQRRLASRGRGHALLLPRRTKPAVLNADWHHGDEDPSVVATTETNSQCSTPIGITGTRTSWRPLSLFRQPRFVLNADWHHGDEDAANLGIVRDQVRVLNADWHHGDEDCLDARARTGSSSAQRRLASRGRGRLCKLVPIMSLQGAQRRLASRGRGHPGGARKVLNRCVLNADWHHGDEDSLPGTG